VSADGKTALSGADDKTLRLWDVESGDAVASFTGDAAFHSVVWISARAPALAGDALGRVHLLEAIFEERC
jgi:WD40 repeat protein